jgi:hypothetical protein
MPAIDLGNAADSLNLRPAFHLFNGHVDCQQQAIRLTNLRGVKISKLVLLHNNLAVVDGTILAFNNCTDAVVSQCTFIGDHDALADESGIVLNNAHSVQITKNLFSSMSPTVGGSCIVVQSNSDVVRITDNLFGGIISGVSRRYDDAGRDTYYRGNN